MEVIWQHFSLTFALMTYLIKSLLVFSFVWISPACKNKGAQTKPPICRNNVLKNPISIQLPIELKEISGLGFIKESKQWVVVNDEKGYLYFLNQNFELINSKRFGPAGDYEGVEVVDSIIYIINSKGKIYCYNYLSEENEKSIKTDLSSKNNIEGLSYDPKKNALIIACKGSPHTGKKKKNVSWKAIYAYSLDKKKLSKKPILKLSKKEIRNFYLDSNTEEKECLNRIERFSPSGITYHAGDDLFYTLSAHGNLLVVSNRAAQIKDLIFLDQRHNQPEGIYIFDDGRIVISDEAREIYGKITSYDF